MRTRIEVALGDELVVAGEAFVVVGLELKLNKPPKLVIKSPLEFAEEFGDRATD